MSTAEIPPVRLSGLARRINAEHVAFLAAAGDAIKRAIEVGRLLVEAKGQLAHGEWAGWVGANCTFDLRQAQKYMRVFDNREALEERMRTPGSHLTSLNSALAMLVDPRPTPDADNRAGEDGEGEGGGRRYNLPTTTIRSGDLEVRLPKPTVIIDDVPQPIRPTRSIGVTDYTIRDDTIVRGKTVEPLPRSCTDWLRRQKEWEPIVDGYYRLMTSFQGLACADEDFEAGVHRSIKKWTADQIARAAEFARTASQTFAAIAEAFDAHLGGFNIADLEDEDEDFADEEPDRGRFRGEG